MLSFASHLLFCVRGADTKFVGKSHPDRVPVSGNGEQSVGPYTAALCSLVSALMSPSLDIVYLVRFDTMRSTSRASSRAEVRPQRLFSPQFPLTLHEHGSTEDRNSIFWNCSPGVLAFVVLRLALAVPHTRQYPHSRNAAYRHHVPGRRLCSHTHLGITER